MRRRSVQLQKSLLNGFARVVVVEQDAVCQPVQSTSVRIVQLGERSVVATRGAGKQRCLAMPRVQHASAGGRVSQALHHAPFEQGPGSGITRSE
jgi:hypothetical protein